MRREPILGPLASLILERHYLMRDRRGRVLESSLGLFGRVARAVAEPDEEPERAERRFLEMMIQQEFLPNSPTLMNAGLPEGMLSGCFVLPAEDSLDGLYDTKRLMAIISACGGGVGLGLGHLPPQEDRSGLTGGPIRWLESFSCELEIVSRGRRRHGAAMGILPIWHADILAFIDCKGALNAPNRRIHESLASQFSSDALEALDRVLVTGQIHNFNLSVAITDSFMAALQQDRDFALRNPRTMQTTRRLRARDLWECLVDRAWRSGEPGLFFVDRANAAHPLPRAGLIEATNPCGEQPLLPFESCNLGSLNVGKFYDPRQRAMDWERLGQAVDWAVRFLDNVIDANCFPDDRLRTLALRHRKIGLGVMGFADLLVKLEIPYDSDEGVATGAQLMAFLSDRSHQASQALAERRGVFPGFEGSLWQLQGRPMRNACTTTVAPTGTISLFANCSSGLEPIYALAYQRFQVGVEQPEVYAPFEAIARTRGLASPERMAELMAHGGSCRGLAGIPEEIQRVFATAHDIAPAWHVRMQAAFQAHCDAAVSKTVNLPASAPREEVDQAFRLAWELGCKGITVYREGARPGQVLTSARIQEHPSEPP